MCTRDIINVILLSLVSCSVGNDIAQHQKTAASIHPSAGQLGNASYYVVGSFNEWDFEQMTPDDSGGELGHRTFSLDVAPPWVPSEFQIVVNRDWQKRLHPPDALSCHRENSSAVGPDAGGHGLNWCLQGRPGDVFRITLQQRQGGDVFQKIFALGGGDEVSMQVRWKVVDHRNVDHAALSRLPFLPVQNITQVVNTEFTAPLRNGFSMYINLERREDRRAKMLELAKPHKWLSSSLQRIVAVDGKSLKWQDLVANGLVTQYAIKAAWDAEKLRAPTIGGPGGGSAHLTLGACGCSLSHRAAWEVLAASTTHDWALIIEDDIVAFADNFDENLVRVLNVLPKDWEIVFVGYHPQSAVANMVSVLKGGRTFSGHLVPLDRPGSGLDGTWGYLLTKQGAKNLLQDCWPMSVQLDRQMHFSIHHRLKSGFYIPLWEFLLFSPFSTPGTTDVQTYEEDMEKDENYQLTRSNTMSLFLEMTLGKDATQTQS